MRYFGVPTISSVAGFVGFLWAGVGATPVHAGVVINEALNNLGAGAVEYTYTVSGSDFLTGAGFDLHFDAATFASIDVTTASSADWIALALTQPDPTLVGADGVADFIANVDHPSLSGTFTVDATLAAGVTFANLGTGTQPFDLFDPTFTITGGGTTTPAGSGAPPTALPLPSTLSLMSAPLLIMSWRVARRRHL